MGRRKGERPEPWERQPGESPQAFEAFAAYRDMGPTRNQRAVAQQLDKSKAIVGRWGSRWDWVARTAAWDSAEALRKSRERGKEREEAEKRHLTLIRALQGLLAKRLQAIKGEELSAADLIRGLVEMIKAERLTLGMETERVTGQEVNVSVDVQQSAGWPRIPWELHKKLLADPDFMEAAHLYRAKKAERQGEPGTVGLPPVPESSETSP